MKRSRHLDRPAILLNIALQLFGLVTVTQSGTLGAADSAAPTARWVSAGNLSVPRFWHSATLLKDGRVLIAGGASGCCPTALDSAEIFDPVTRTWSVTGRMQLARVLHSATLLRDGKVLVIGGTSSAQAELYDPATGTWTFTGSLISVPDGNTATLLQSGMVLVSGGAQGGTTLNSAELYDPTTGQWSPTGDLVDARTAHTATRLNDGRVLVAGGLVLNPVNIELPDQLKTAERYDPITGQWQLTTRPNRIYLSPQSLLLTSGKVLLLGDVGDTEQYDPANATWTITGTRVVGAQRYAATALASGRVLVAGGYDSRTASFVGGAEIYDEGTGGWTDTAPLAVPRRDHTATLLSNGSVLVAGGVGPSGAGETTLASAEIYQASSPADIGPAFTGSWYDPAQNGHGLFIEVLTGNRFFASWFTFNPAGTEQAWFTGVGTYSGNTAFIANVDMPSGGRWIPNFDPTRVVHNAWGTLTFTFTDCNHGRVDFDSVLGYGSGSMNLTRLTQPAGLACP